MAEERGRKGHDARSPAKKEAASSSHLRKKERGAGDVSLGGGRNSGSSSSEERRGGKAHGERKFRVYLLPGERVRCPVFFLSTAGGKEGEAAARAPCDRKGGGGGVAFNPKRKEGVFAGLLHRRGKGEKMKREMFHLLLKREEREGLFPCSGRRKGRKRTG